MALKTSRVDLVRTDEYGNSFHKPYLPFYHLMGGVPGVDYDVEQGIVVRDWPLEVEQAFATVQDYANYLSDISTVDISDVSDISTIDSGFRIVYYDNLIIVAEIHRDIITIVEPKGPALVDSDVDPVPPQEPV